MQPVSIQLPDGSIVGPSNPLPTSSGGGGLVDVNVKELFGVQYPGAPMPVTVENSVLATVVHNNSNFATGAILAGSSHVDVAVSPDMFNALTNGGALTVGVATSGPGSDNLTCVFSASYPGLTVGLPFISVSLSSSPGNFPTAAVITAPYPWSFAVTASVAFDTLGAAGQDLQVFVIVTPFTKVVF